MAEISKGLWGRLVKDLTNLRTRGMDNPRVDDLDDLTNLAAELVPDDALTLSVVQGARYWEGNSDEDVRRVEVLLECAIDAAFLATESPRHSPIEAEIARLWFGLDSKTRHSDQAQRHERAAELGGIEKETMERSRAMSIKNGLAQVLDSRHKDACPFTLQEATRETTPAPIKEGSGKKKQATESPRRKARVPRQLVGATIGLAVGCVGVAVAVLALVGTFGSSGAARTFLPPRGSAINATTGEIDPRPKEEPAANIWPLTKTSRLIRVCDVTAGMICAKPDSFIDADSLEVNPGDTIRLQAVLDAKPYDPIPFLRLAVQASHEEPAHALPVSPNELQITRQIYWKPGTSNDGLPETYTVGPEATRLTISGQGRARLRYVPGSTELLDSQHHRLGRLPDGIMEPAGVKLTELGAPASCKFDCELQYLRLVQFDAVASLAAH